MTLAALSLFVTGCGSNGSTNQTSDTTGSTATTVTPNTSGATSTTLQRDTAVWPEVDSAVRYSDPAAAAKGFAVSYLGFVDPVIGTFRQGDSRSGEVPVSPKTESGAAGPETTVLVRKLAPDDSWWVLGASTADIQLTSPAALATITSPVTLTGRSTAFEATVNMEVRQNGTLTPLAQGVVMGGSNGQMGPFSKTVTYGAPTAGAGAIVLLTKSAANGSTASATVVPVIFSP